MDTLTSIEKFMPERTLNQNEIKHILYELTGLNGITMLNVEEDYVRVEYYQQLLSSDLVKDALVRAGFPFVHDARVQGLLNKFIRKIGEDNNKEFGGKPPKCCG